MQVKTIFLILGIVFCLILLTNQLFSAPPSDKKPESDKKEKTAVIKPQVYKPEIQKESTLPPETQPSFIPQNKVERGKTEMYEPAQRSTTASQPVEEGGLLSGIWEFLKILLIVVIAVSAGYLFLLFYRIYRKIKKIDELDEYINTLRKAIEEEVSQQAIARGQGTDHFRKYPIGVTREESSSQEISRINQKIEALERRFNIYSDDHKKILEESRRQNTLYSLLKELFRKQTSAQEIILQEMNKVKKGSIPSYEEPEIRKEEPEKQTLQTKKPFTEQHLIESWNEFGKQRLSTCRETIAERFSDVKSEVILEGRYPDEWKVIGISKTSDNLYYVVPFKGGRWWTDYSKGISDYKKWFELEEEKEDMTLTIGSVILPLPKARKVISGWELISPKGRVSIKESQ